jgi:type IV secretion system protein VirB10
VNNDGVIEVKSKGGPGKKILILLVVFILVFVVIGVIAKLTSSDAPPSTAPVKTNEALQKTVQDDRSVMNRIQEIEESAKRKAEQESADKAAAERQAREEAEAKRRQLEAQQRQAQVKQSSAAEQMKAGAQSAPPSSSRGGRDKDRPLTKSERVLVGETLVKLDQREAEPAKQDSDDFLKGGTYADGLASLVGNRQLLLSAGTAMSCVLKTKIVTSYPGITMCQLTKDIYSDNGEVLLARAGSQLIGEQKKAITQGQARVFVNWTTIKDGNVSVRIDALGADGLGASGLPAWVDNHFWERFGGAMLMSFIDDALAASTSQLAKSGTDQATTFQSSTETGSKMAEIALENSINIPPTAYVNQGEVLTVIVPRNIDFSTVYEVR